MKIGVFSALFLAVTFGAFSATDARLNLDEYSAKRDPSAAQGMKVISRDQNERMMQADESNHVLAMAYQQNLAAFAKAMHEHTEQASSVNVEFARAAEIEIRRSFGKLKLHHEEHLKTMSAEMQKKTSGKRKQMETHHTELTARLDALEKEADLAAPDAKRVSTLASDIQSHCEAISIRQQGNQAEKISN